MDGKPRLLAAPDKFRGTASATEIATAIARAAVASGWSAEAVPVSDGGEGLLDCFGGANRHTGVRGPLGATVRAPWRLDRGWAVIEMAAASGLRLVGGVNDPLAATTTGTGELVAAAIEAGASHILVGAGGSAATDGGLGAVEVLRRYGPLDGSRGYQVDVATDVSIPFLDTAELFGPQKGADPDQVVELTSRLRTLATRYQAEFGIEVAALRGSGAAGGLAGGLAALGACLRPGIDLVADVLDLRARIGAADLVVTGEGLLDRSTFLGKAPGAVVRMCSQLGTPVALIVGEIAEGVTAPAPTVSLLATFGADAALGDTVRCVEAAVTALLAIRGDQSG